MTKIYLTRHGQTEWNVDHRFQGFGDSPLTPLGIKNAIQLGKSLSKQSFDHIYSSSSNRAHHTAKLIRGNKNTPITLLDDLKELNLGEWEGLTHDEVKEKFPENYVYFWEEPDRYVTNGGESLNELLKRTEKVLNFITKEHPNETILMVAHTVTIKAIYLLTKKKAIKNLWDPPYLHDTCLTVLHYVGANYEFLVEGDLSHLELE